MANIKFILDGCDISFIAEAPEDMTLKELLKQCDRIRPDWCACGIKSYIYPEKKQYETPTELLFTKNNVIKVANHVACKIYEDGEWRK